ncbi:MAG: PAS domain-containing protein [Actinomycetota bacterium]
MQETSDRHDNLAEAVRDSFRPAIDLAPVITYIDDLDGASTSLYVSPQTEELLGFSEQDWLDDPDLWEKMIHPDDLERVLRENDESETTGYFSTDYRILTRDGRTRWIHDEAVIVRDGDTPIFWRGSMVDITDRKLVEDTLRRTEAQYRALVERIPGCVYIEELETSRLIYMSPQIEEITGYPDAAFVRTADMWHDIVHPDDRARYMEADHDAGVSGEAFLMEYRTVRPDGTVVWVRDESHQIVEDGVPLFRQGLVIDVTERHVAERERAELLGRLVTAQEEERARIASSIHDEPIQKMTAVGLRLFTLRSHVRGEGTGAVLDQLESSVNEAITRMRGLLFELRPPALERDGLASALRQYADTTAREGDPRVTVESLLTIDPPMATRTIAYRIVQEALSNARRHARATRIAVELDGHEGGVRGRVIDDGSGFTVDAAGALAADAAHLGIATMRERAEMAKGWIRVESGPGEGTSVEFWLPAT